MFLQGDKLPVEVVDAVVDTVVLYTIDFIQHRPDLIESEVLTAAALRLPYLSKYIYINLIYFFTLNK